MSQPLRVLHASCGRLMLVQLGETIADQAGQHTKLVFKIDGSDLNVFIGDQTHRLTLGEVVMISAWECHSYASVDPAMASLVLVVEIDSRWERNQHHRLNSGLNRVVSKKIKWFLASAIQEAVDELAELLAYEMVLTAERLEEGVASIVRLLADTYEEVPEVHGSARRVKASCDSRIRKVLSIMATTVGEPILVEQLARAVNLSRPHFFNLFKQATGMTPLTYANMLRLEQAVQQISQTRMPLEKIAIDLGFESPGNFTRFFKSHHGFPPSQYRRKVSVLLSGSTKTPAQ